MATGQLWLFPPPRPLVERFGEEFFRQLPTRPGVYLFCGPSEGVLYFYFVKYFLAYKGMSANLSPARR